MHFMALAVITVRTNAFMTVLTYPPTCLPVYLPLTLRLLGGQGLQDIDAAIQRFSESRAPEVRALQDLELLQVGSKADGMSACACVSHTPYVWTGVPCRRRLFRTGGLARRFRGGAACS